jgi:hypothetical protein
MWTSSRAALLATRLVVTAVALTCVAAAQTPLRVDGTWTGEANAHAAPPFPVTMVFKTNGKSLTGFASVDDGPQVPLQEGTIEGEHVSFLFEWFGGPVYCEGTVSATEVKLKAPTEIGIIFDIVLTRKK